MCLCRNFDSPSSLSTHIYMLYSCWGMPILGGWLNTPIFYFTLSSLFFPPTPTFPPPSRRRGASIDLIKCSVHMHVLYV